MMDKGFFLGDRNEEGGRRNSLEKTPNLAEKSQISLDVLI